MYGMIKFMNAFLELWCIQIFWPSHLLLIAYCSHTWLLWYHMTEFAHICSNRILTAIIIGKLTVGAFLYYGNMSCMSVMFMMPGGIAHIRWKCYICMFQPIVDFSALSLTRCGMEFHQLTVLWCSSTSKVGNSYMGFLSCMMLGAGTR